MEFTEIFEAATAAFECAGPGKEKKEVPGINNQDEEGNSPLHKAVASESVELVECLLYAGADVTSVNEAGETALQVCFGRLGKKAYAIMKMLLNAGSYVNTKSFFTALTALHHAVENQDVDFLKFLLKEGADINARDERGWTSLHYAASVPNLQVIEFLLEAEAHVNALESTGETPLHILLYSTDDSTGVEMLRLFLRHGVDVNVQNYKGETCLHQACSCKKPLLVESLLEHGAQFDVPDIFNETPLHHAVRAVNDESLLDLVKHLLRRDPDINVISSDGVNILSVEKDAYPECLWKMIVEHIVKEQARGLEIHPSLQHVISTTAAYDSYVNTCQEELWRLKEFEISSDCWVALLHLLVCSEKKLIAFANNQDLVSDFEKIDVVERFPIYGALIHKRFSEAIERNKIIQKSSEALSELLPANLSPRDLVIQKIIEYCTVKDFKNLCL